ncbi:Protein CBG18888 [Caenorhabditis briggsae]|uniref:Protein CBG18888 n=1 Tax=Caenorhabditis briggsae TaxID=6238 RepID=A8XUA5_CAEBR|nr:Protein CBG18888 [Caenorhabditis briggsae]CAP36230.2 Protein CBG18888 [Caenorhabditis briggsae]
MIGKSWSVIQHNIQIEFAIMSLILNSTLIFLILRHSPKSLVVYGAIWGWVAYDPVGQQPATGEHIKQENNILETFDLELEDMVYIGPYFYQKLPNGTYEVDIMSITGMSIVYIIVSSSFFTIFYFGIKCYRIISQLVPSTSSYRSKQLQSHLFWALVTQTMIPVILMHTPVTLVYAFALLDQDIGMLSGFVSMTIAAYPAIDPLPSLLIIPCYRGALKKYLPCCRRPKDTQQETTNPAGPRTASILSVKPT